MGEYEENARTDNIIRALNNLQIAVEDRLVAIEQSIEWSTGEITRSVGGLTEALASPRQQPSLGFFRAMRLRMLRRQERGLI